MRRVLQPEYQDFAFAFTGYWTNPNIANSFIYSYTQVVRSLLALKAVFGVFECLRLGRDLISFLAQNVITWSYTGLGNASYLVAPGSHPCSVNFALVLTSLMI